MLLLSFYTCSSLGVGFRFKIFLNLTQVQGKESSQKPLKCSVFKHSNSSRFWLISYPWFFSCR